MAYVYKIVNTINNKIYIGKTEFSLDKRFQEHCRDALKDKYKNRPLYSAMRKYGIKNFTISLIEETDCPEEREKFWIETLQTFKYGYNATIGGDGKHYLDYDLIIKTYQEVKNCNKVAKLLNIHPDSVRNVLHIKNITMFPWLEVVQQNFNKPVAQIDLKTQEIIAVFNSITDAEKTINIYGHIGQVCQGKRKSCGGYGWKYL